MRDLFLSPHIHDSIIGPPDTGVILIEYGDYTNPYTKSMYRHIKDILERAGNIQYIFRAFPDKENENSLSAAKAAKAASFQGKFWEMHSMILRYKNDISKDVLFGFAKAAGCKEEQFKIDFYAFDTAAAITNEITNAIKSDVTYDDLPAMFINLQRYRGDMNEEDIIQALMSKQHPSDIKDIPVINTQKNIAEDYDRNDPHAYEIDPMPVNENSGYIAYSNDPDLYKPLSGKGITLEEYEDSIGDQDHAEPEPD